MEEFALMSEEEMEDAFAEVIEMLGDDAEAIAEMQKVMEEVRSMNADAESKYETIVLHDELTKATKAALDMLSKSDWGTVYEKRSEILESIIHSGKVSSEDAAVFKSDPDAWEKELKEIWGELQKQALMPEL
jgi:DNA integrity scanning protein DisA with diadenylate cyclase activity